MTDADVKAELAGKEFLVLGLTILGEASSEPIEGKVFVGCIVRNRVLSKRRWPMTYDGVCLQKWQFSCWLADGGAANYARLMVQAHRLVGDHAEASAIPKDPALDECLFVAEGIIGGQLRDRAEGCNHYVTKALFKADPPAWAKGRPPALEVGHHLGFKL